MVSVATAELLKYSNKTIAVHNLFQSRQIKHT